MKINPGLISAKNILILVLTSILFFNFFSIVSKKWQVYTRAFYPDRYVILKNLYDQSQYVRSLDPIIIPDEYYYALAGYNYLHGMNPILFNGEQPPLGKYFVSLTINFFNNETLTGPIFNLLCLVIFFFLGDLILKSKIWSLLMVTIFSFEKIFEVQMIYVPLLDNIQLFFILGGFYFFLLWWRGKISLILAFLFLGFVISVKFWITGAVIFTVWFLSLSILRKKQLISFFLYSPIMLIPLVISYLPGFFYQETIRRIIGVQKYIYVYHSGKFHFDPLAFFDLVLLNRFHVTWENTIKSSVDFQMTWPILLLVSLLAVYKVFTSKKFSDEIKIVAIWFIIYTVFLFFGTVLARYLIPVLPAMYLLSFYMIRNFLKK